MANRAVFPWSAKPAGSVLLPAGFAILALLGSSPSLAQSPARIAASAAVAGPVAARGPVWLSPANRPAALALLDLIETSELDGLKSSKFAPGKLKRALRESERGNPSSLSRADDLFNQAYVRYVAALRSNARGDWEVVDPVLVPKAPDARALLAEAARQPSLPEFIGRMGFMHESYAGLRRALAAAEDGGDKRTAALLRINLQRARFLPSSGKYVVVNSAAQRLFLYDGGKLVDSMKVVVGKPEQPTPMMAALIRFTNLNPYWNLPHDLVAERVAPNVLKDGLPYLKAKGYVILSDYGEKAKVIDPSTVDWQAVQAGRIQLRMRQNPGPLNSMGRMKFMFPNRHGVYLHDTPNKELLGEDARLFSAGCVRLEDAPRLARWLYGRPLAWQGKKPEAKVDLKQPVPVYLAYLTASNEGGKLAFYPDIYGRDQAKLAGRKRGLFAAR